MHHVNNDELRLLMEETPNLLILDVRTPTEFDSLGHIPNAVNRPVQLMNEWGDSIAPTQPVAIICQHGRRSLVAAEYLETQLGVASIYNLIDGMAEWDGELIN